MKDGLDVKAIPNSVAQSMSIRNHYLHRECPCSQAYGLFNEDGRMIGVCIYGVPSSSTLKKGICGEEEAEHVIELKRLFVEEDAPRFAESAFISRTIRMMKDDQPNYDIIVSYADSGYGHVGTVYQATHWIYTGLSAAFKDYIEEGNDKDHLTQADSWKAKYGSASKAREVLGDKVITIERSRKHRYVYFNGKSRARNVQLQSKLNYPIQPYPKRKEGLSQSKIINSTTVLPLEDYIHD